MAIDDKHFRLRLPEQLKQRLQTSADDNGRSMTAEINARLEASYLFLKPEMLKGATPELVNLIRTIVYETIAAMEASGKD